MHLSPFNLVLQIVNFLVLAWLLQRFLFRPARDVLAKRRAAMEASAREAAEAKSEAARIVERCRAEAAQMAAEAEEERGRARAIGEEEARRLREEASRQASAELARAKKAVERERHEALDALELRATDLATTIAERLLREVLPDDAPFLWRVTARIDALDAADKSSIAAQLARGVAQLASSRALDDATRARFERWIGEVAGRKVQPSYVLDPSLVAGVELRLPMGTWRANVRASIERIRAELVPDEHAA